MRSTLSYTGTTPILSEPKTGNSRRLVPLDKAVIAMLRGQKLRQAEVRLRMGPEYQDEGFVFAGVMGEPLKPATVSRTFARLVARHKLPALTVHGLRHTWATVALGAGIPAKVASEILGHSSISITLDTYTHALPSMQQEATELVAARVFAARPLEVR